MGKRYDLQLEPKTALERHVARWLRQEARERNHSIASVMLDLTHGGCISGFVRHLISYHQTDSFYRRFQRDIGSIVSELQADHGEPIGSIVRHWDHTDPLALERCGFNRNVLAWLGFEEAARTLAYRAGWEG